jgi:hypothetical protein
MPKKKKKDQQPLDGGHERKESIVVAVYDAG